MHKSGFTLIEIMIAVLITAIIMLGGFAALSAVTIGKVRLIEKTNIEKEASYFSEKLFEMIKSGGTLDYEEYWNRKITNGNNTSFTGGHFETPTGYGNFGDSSTLGTTSYGNELYYCLSGNNVRMGTAGCVSTNNTSTGGAIIEIDYAASNEPQRYGQYALQFINFNLNADNDNGLPGDEDGDGSIIGDDDDEYLGEGPEVFASGTGVTELYLISGDSKTRTYFRYHVGLDPDAPSVAGGCSTTDGKNYTGSGCLGTIQFLKLSGKDWGSNHDVSNDPDNGTLYDGIIDTWIIDPKFESEIGDVVADSNNNDYWQDLFPKTMHVSDFQVFAYPHKDRNLAWKDNNSDVNIAPYIRMSLKLKPSWKKRKLIQGSIPELDLSTTISLSELYSQ